MRQLLEMTIGTDLILGTNPSTGTSLFHYMGESHSASLGFNFFICKKQIQQGVLSQKKPNLEFCIFLFMEQEANNPCGHLLYKWLWLGALCLVVSLKGERAVDFLLCFI